MAGKYASELEFGRGPCLLSIHTCVQPTWFVHRFESLGATSFSAGATVGIRTISSPPQYVFVAFIEIAMLI